MHTVLFKNPRCVTHLLVYKCVTQRASRNALSLPLSLPCWFSPLSVPPTARIEQLRRPRPVVLSYAYSPRSHRPGR
jgi:hypothetical protein